MSDFKNIDSPTNRKSGAHDIFYFAPISWFDQIVSPPSASIPFQPGNNPITIYQNHVFNPGFGFLKGLSAHNTNLFKIIAQGSIGNKSLNKKFEAFFPGSNTTLHGVMSTMLNDRFIIMVQEADCDGEITYQLGSSCVAAYLSSAEYTTGTLDGQEVKGWKVEFMADFKSVLLYAGAIPLVAKSSLAFGSYTGPNHTVGVAGQNYNMGWNIIGSLPMWILPNSVYPAGWTVSVQNDTIIINSNTPLNSGDAFGISLNLSNGVNPDINHQYHINVP